MDREDLLDLVRRRGPPRLTYEQKRELGARPPEQMTPEQLNNARWLAAWRIVTHTNPSEFLQRRFGAAKSTEVVRRNHQWLDAIEYEENVRLARGAGDQP